MQVTTRMNPDWWSLFDPSTPNDPILRSVLGGRSPGTAYLDRAANPSQVLIRTHCGETFANLGASETFLHEALDLAIQRGWTSVIDSGLPDSVRARGKEVSRTQFDDCDLTSDELRALRERLPDGIEVRPLDRTLFERAHHSRRELSAGYGEALDSYFDFGYGIYLLSEGEIVSESYVGYLGDGRNEVNVGTVDAWRGKGLASIASAFLAEETCRRGHAFTWSCITENAPSLAVARKLAFRSERPYCVYYF